MPFIMFAILIQLLAQNTEKKSDGLDMVDFPFIKHISLCSEILIDIFDCAQLDEKNCFRQLPIHEKAKISSRCYEIKDGKFVIKLALVEYLQERKKTEHDYILKIKKSRLQAWIDVALMFIEMFPIHHSKYEMEDLLKLEEKINRCKNQINSVSDEDVWFIERFILDPLRMCNIAAQTAHKLACIVIETDHIISILCRDLIEFPFEYFNLMPYSLGRLIEDVTVSLSCTHHEDILFDAIQPINDGNNNDLVGTRRLKNIIKRIMEPFIPVKKKIKNEKLSVSSNGDLIKINDNKTNNTVHLVSGIHYNTKDVHILSLEYLEMCKLCQICEKNINKSEKDNQISTN